MRSQRLIGFLLLLGAVLLVTFLLLLRARNAAAAYGPALALCPGPDLYGYTCDAGDAVSYIDATNDTALYADDGFLALDLPFPITFYGVDYSAVNVVTNGFLHFGADPLPFFQNLCLTEEGPLADLGAAALPLWDDLDVRFSGFIETELVGEAPDRIFVIEWDDVPRFGGDPEDTVTFEVQLREESNDLLFLYEDPDFVEFPGGGSATIGLHSTALGTALQFSCDRSAVGPFDSLRLVYPSDPNPELDAAAGIVPAADNVLVKGDAGLLLEQLTLRGPAALTDLRVRWLGAAAARDASWLWTDLNGDGAEDLIHLWRGPRAFPERHQLTLLQADSAGYDVVFNAMLANRESVVLAPQLMDAVDVTGDGLPDLLLRDEADGRLFVFTADGGSWSRVDVPGRCSGAVNVKDGSGDGVAEIIRDGCGGPARLTVQWWRGRFLEQ